MGFAVPLFITGMMEFQVKIIGELGFCVGTQVAKEPFLQTLVDKYGADNVLVRPIGSLKPFQEASFFGFERSRTKKNRAVALRRMQERGIQYRDGL